MYKDIVDKEGGYNTPLYLFNYLNKHFKFGLDPCDTGNNWLGVPFTFKKKDNGLEKEWKVNTFVNPPYGAINERNWIEKCIKESEKYGTANFILLPSKTESKWFANAMIRASIIIFIKKRISFVKDGKPMKGNTIGSVIFGFFRCYDPEPQFFYPKETDVGKIASEFFMESAFNNNIPFFYSGIDKVILFPDRDLLIEKYSKV